MSSIFCILNKTKSTLNKEDYLELFRPINTWTPDGYYTWFNQDVFLENYLLNTSSSSESEHLKKYYEESNCVIVSDSRLDYRRDLVRNLEEDWEVFKNYPDSYFILKSYLKWGPDCVNYLFGDFAFALWDAKKKELFFARDHFGIRPLFYLDHQEYFYVSSDIGAFLHLSKTNCTIEEESILRSICASIPSKESTPFTGVTRLIPAHSILVQKSGKIQISQYWSLREKGDFIELDEDEAISGLRERFLDSLKSKLGNDISFGIELSGGLDSSSIAACLTKLKLDRGMPIYAFTHTKNPEATRYPKSNINSFAICKEVFGTNSNFIIKPILDKGQQSISTALLEYLKHYPQPISQNFAVMSDLLLIEAQKQGVRILLSGYGGDEGITHNGAYYLNELAFQRRWNRIKSIYQKKAKLENKRYPWNFFLFFLRYNIPGLISLIKRIYSFDKNSYREVYRIIPVNKRLRRRGDIRKNHLSGLKYPKDSDLRQRQKRRINSAHISDRLENTYFAARNRRIEYRYPFLDVKVLEFYYSIQSRFKYKDGINRYLFKMAMEGILDDRIRLQREKFGAAIPYMNQRVIKDEAWFRKLIEESRSKNSYHYIDYNGLQRMIDQIKLAELNRAESFPLLVFFPAISVLLLQKWQREGKIDIGIKY